MNASKKLVDKLTALVASWDSDVRWVPEVVADALRTLGFVRGARWRDLWGNDVHVGNVGLYQGRLVAIDW